MSRGPDFLSPKEASTLRVSPRSVIGWSLASCRMNWMALGSPVYAGSVAQPTSTLNWPTSRASWANAVPAVMTTRAALMARAAPSCVLGRERCTGAPFSTVANACATTHESPIWSRELSVAETERGRWPLQEVTAEAFEGRERTQATGGRRGKHGDSCPGEPVGEPL